MRVGVVGGSLGGVTAALLLRDAGCDVEVFERSESGLLGYGAGLGVDASSLRYARERLGTDVDALSFVPRSVRYLDRSGAIVYQAPSDQRVTTWTTLHRHLVDAFGSERYHRGCQVVGLEQDADQVQLQFADGGRRIFDFVVGADGVGSTVRSILFPEVSLAYSGYVSWRGIVPRERLDTASYEQLAEDMTYFVGDRTQILAAAVPGEVGDVRVSPRSLIFAWYRNVDEQRELPELLTDKHGVRRAVTVPRGMVSEDQRMRLIAAAVHELPEVFAKFVCRTPDPFIAVIGDLESPRMVDGRVALIGDAAFAARPHTAAGTAKVCHNAWTLSEAVKAGGGRLELEAWNRSQVALGRAVVRRAREVGERALRYGTWTPGDPDLRSGLFGPGQSIEPGTEPSSVVAAV